VHTTHSVYGAVIFGNICDINMGIHEWFFRDQESIHCVPIPINELHSPFDHEYMWRCENKSMYKPKEECGCYETQMEDEHEHYTRWTTHHHKCPEHYAIHLANVERKRQRDMEEKIERDKCTDILLALAKEKQREMTDIIHDITVPFLKNLNDTLPDNMFYRTCRCIYKCRCIYGCFRNTVMNDHTCTCKYEVAFHGIKYKKIAKKTYKFNIPDHSGNIGKITLYHCKCHRKNMWGDGTFNLKPLVS
jgi:hypothetical protein